MHIHFPHGNKRRPECPECGADVSGIIEAKVAARFPCPECGRRLSPLDVKRGSCGVRLDLRKIAVIIRMHLDGLFWITLRGLILAGVTAAYVVVVEQLAVSVYAGDPTETHSLGLWWAWPVRVGFGVVAACIMMLRLSYHTGGKTALLDFLAGMAMWLAILAGTIFADSMVDLQLITVVEATISFGFWGTVFIFILLYLDLD